MRYTTTHFIADHWEWIAGTILIPLLVWAWNNKKKNTEYNESKKLEIQASYWVGVAGRRAISPPQRPDHGATCLQQSLRPGIECIVFFAFDIDRASHVPALIKYWDDDLRASAAERGQVSQIACSRNAPKVRSFRPNASSSSLSRRMTSASL
jgi:hypothetical protein